MPENIHISRETETQKTKVVGQEKTFQEKIDDFLIEHQSVKTKELVVFFRLLATMLNAGVSLVKSLKVLAEQTTNKKMQKVILKLVVDIENGQNLSDSMAEFPNVFDTAQIGMIHSGEASGKLNKILLQLADQFERSSAIKSKIKNAMIYPAAIISFVMIAGLVMMYMVVPQLTAVFRDANVELPALTKVIVFISDFLKGQTMGIPNILLVILAIITFILGFFKWKNTLSGRILWQKFVLKLPLFGNLTRKAILAQFCQGLSSLNSSGISIVKSLQIVADIVGNEVYRRRILLISEDVKKGISIAENLKDDTKLFPTMVASMIQVGEQTAQLDVVTEKIAKFYQEEVDDMVKNLSSLLEPFIIVIIGIGVGLLVAGIMKPIMMMSEVASQM